MSKLVLVGGGGHCKSVLDAAIAMGKYSEIVITDPELKKGDSILGCRIVGSDDVLLEIFNEGFSDAFISVGSIESCELRKKLSKMVEEIGFFISTIIDPSAAVSKNAVIDEGTFIGKNAVVNAGARIGKNCIINSGTIIEHDSIVGDYSHISVGAVMCGGSTVGREAFIGAGSTIIQGIFIGDAAVVGAGSTVLTNVKSNERVYGIVK